MFVKPLKFMYLSLNKFKIYEFGSTKRLKVQMCGACSYGRDLQFLKRQVWKLDPSIAVQDERSVERSDGKFEVSLLTQTSSEPKLLYSGLKEGRITPFNVGGIIKQIRDA